MTLRASKNRLPDADIIAQRAIVLFRDAVESAYTVEFRGVADCRSLLLMSLTVATGEKKVRWLTLRRERALVGLLISIAIIVGFRFFVSDPRSGAMHVTMPTGQEIHLFNCPFREITGIPCPICGITRATALAVRGYPLRSFRVSPLGILVVLGAMYGIIRGVFVLLGREAEIDEEKSRRNSRRFVIFVLVILTLTWAISIGRHFEWIRW